MYPDYYLHGAQRKSERLQLRQLNMKRILRPIETLVYYDGPELFVAQDQLHAHYFCLLVEVTESSENFLCAPIFPEKLSHFYRGQIDLRHIYENPETEELFFINITPESEQGFLLVPIVQEIPDIWLPDKGFFLTREIVDNVVLQEADKLRAKLKRYNEIKEQRDE